MSQQFSAVNNAANEGAFGNNPRPEPTLAQLAAGNYKKGHITLHGLNIAIENPAFSYRQGIDANGQKWTCLMQAHYGYIKGFKGNDGDEVDVFVGHVPESDTAYIINQKKQGGYFDEHKIMLGFLSQQQAVDTYQHCFERGWTGLMSVVPCTIEQFKWWLANGDKSRPVTVNRLPYAGLERLDSVSWNDDKLCSHGGKAHNVMYQIRQSDVFDQALEPMLFTDMVQELGNQGFVYENYDALVTEYNKLERKAQQLLTVMQATATAVKPVRVVVSKPLTKNGVANVIAWFEMDDGQAVGVFFHNPDKNPKKLDPTDEMISYKWVLNKKDITIAVAPEQGKDLNVRTVAKRIMQLVDKNHDRFMKANSAKAELNIKEQDLNAQVTAKQSQLDMLNKDIELLEAQKAEKEAFNLTSQQKTDKDTHAENAKSLIKLANDFGKTKDGFLGTVEAENSTKKTDKLFKETLGGEWCFSVFSGFSGATLSILYALGGGEYTMAHYEQNNTPEQTYQGMLNDKGYQQAVMVKDLSQLLIDIQADKFSDTELLSKESALKNGYSLIGGDAAQESTIKEMYKTAFQKIEDVKTKEISSTKPTTQERPADYRTNLANARAVAKSLGIETKGKKLDRLLKDIAVFDENEVKKELLAEFKALASRLVLPKGYMFDLTDAEKSIGDITRWVSPMIRKQGKIDTNSIRVELRTVPRDSYGEMTISNFVFIYTDDQKTKKDFEKFDYQKFGDIGGSSPKTPKAIVAKMEDFLTKAIFPEIEYLKVVNSTNVDVSKLSEIGIAEITDIGDENLYFEKDGKYYVSKVGNTQNYALGEWDFAKYPDGVVSQATEPKQSESEHLMTNPDRDYLQSIIDGKADLSNADEIEAKLTDIGDRLNAELEPLFEQAAEAFAQYAIAQAATV